MLTIPPIVPPEPEESRETAIHWYTPLIGTSLDELPPDVIELSVPTLFFDFPRELIEPVLNGDINQLDYIVEEIDQTIGWDDKFFKLNTRSPKDCYSNHGITCSAKQALSWFVSSERVTDDLVYMTHLKGVVNPKICVRDPFFSVEGFGRWEFRCFVKDGKLIAVSDYDYHKPNQHLELCDAMMHSQIVDFFKILHPKMHLETYVFDVVKTCEKLVLIEINPYGMSDPCFFKTYQNVENANPGIIQTTMMES